MEVYLLGIILLAWVQLNTASGPIDTHATSETKTLYNVLRSVARDPQKILVGKQKPNLYGLYGGHSPYWRYDYLGKQQAWQLTPAMAHSQAKDDLCDPCAVTHDFPAVAGYDFGMIGEHDDTWVYAAKKAHERGAIITFSMHIDNLVTGQSLWNKHYEGAYHTVRRLLPGGDHYHSFEAKMDKVADVIKNKLLDRHGNHIPIIFRPWHEANGGWFWWGYGNDAHNSVDDIKKLFQSTVTYLKDRKGVHSVLYAFSPDCGGSHVRDDIYPGNDYVDIIGTDCYLTPSRSPDTIKAAIDKVVHQAETNGKIPALTETGILSQDMTKRPHFYTHDLLNTFKTSSGMRLAYMLTWTNQWKGEGRYDIFDPYPGHPLAHDYLDFYNDYRTYFVGRLKSHYPELNNN